MIDATFAKEFGHDWISAWNAHDIEAVMRHYSADIVFQSPLIVAVNNDAAGTIRDKAVLRAYFEKALTIYPDLHFELYKVLACINSVVIYYKSINERTAAEYMELDEKGRVVRVCAHYDV